MLSLDTLSRADKLQLMEALWDDLTTNTIELASPGWHAKALDAAQEAHAAGQAVFVDWSEAKRKLRQE